MRRLIVMLVMLAGSSLLFSQTTRYVADGENLQSAINASASGDTIKVSKGVYGAINITFKVHIVATDPVDSVQIISSGSAVQFNFNSVGATLTGFTITATNGIGVYSLYDVLISYCKITGCGTSGADMSAGTLLNCTIENNTVGVNGNNNVNPQIIGCKIRNNTGNGIDDFSGYASADSITSNGSGSDAGIDLWSGATVVGCVIKSNNGYGLYARSQFNNSTAFIYSNEISNNTLDGYQHNYSNAENIKIYNNLIKDNGGNGIQWKADISNQTVIFEIVNNVIYGNAGYGVYFNDISGSTSIFNDVILKNNIISANANGIGKSATYNVSDIILSYNDVVGNTNANYADGFTAGLHDISVDPQFTNTATNDFTLQAGSPCINAGIPQLSLYDLDRTRNDMGIYGGSFTWTNYFNNSSGALVAKYTLSDQAVIKGENITIQATGVVR